MRLKQRVHGAAKLQLLLGAVIVALGVLLLASNLGVHEARYVMKIVWPLALITVGAMLMRTYERGQGRWWGLVATVAGAWLLAEHLGWLKINFWHFFHPAVLLFAGVILIWRTRKNSAARAESDNETVDVPLKPRLRAVLSTEEPEFLQAFALLSNTSVRPALRPVYGGSVAALMGGATIDLRECELAANTVTIDVGVLMGGIEIYVPREWAVSNRVIAIMGGCSDRRKPAVAPPNKIIVLRGMALMGGIEIKT